MWLVVGGWWLGKQPFQTCHSDAEGGIELLPIHWLTILKLLWAKNPVLIIQRGKNPPDCSPLRGLPSPLRLGARPLKPPIKLYTLYRALFSATQSSFCLVRFYRRKAVFNPKLFGSGIPVWVKIGWDYRSNAKKLKKNCKICKNNL